MNHHAVLCRSSWLRALLSLRAFLRTAPAGRLAPCFRQGPHRLLPFRTYFSDSTELLANCPTHLAVTHARKQMESGNELIVHVLNAEVSSWRAYHGKIIRAAQRFRGEVRDYPNTQMLLFHSQQCAIKCLRGWSAF